MIGEPKPGGSPDDRAARALAPAIPLAVIDIAMSAPGAPNSEAFWAAERLAAPSAAAAGSST